VKRPGKLLGSTPRLLTRSLTTLATIAAIATTPLLDLPEDRRLRLGATA
jgi:hypothetical protein